MSREPYESDAVEIGLVAGFASGLTPAYELDGTEILAYQAEQAARAARRACPSDSGPGWPHHRQAPGRSPSSDT